jgi:class 3 adenylate cyclase
VDRFLTTVLMIDMVGSTELAAELGDRGWRELVQAPKVVSEMLAAEVASLVGGGG